MEYRLLGPLVVRRDGESVDIGGYKLRALLALLLIHADEVVSTDRLIDEVWGDHGGADRQNSLWVSISGLRRALDPERKKRTDGTVLLTRAPGYLLATADADLDVRRFEQLAAEGRALLEVDPAAAALVLQEALSVWRGHALEEFTYEPWAQAEIARLEELRLTALEDRVFADLRAGRARELVGELEGLVREHPLRERLTGHLMLALHRSGRQAEALRAFGSLRTRLGEELGLEPSAELTRLEERIVLDDPELAMATTPTDSDGATGLIVRGYELRDRLAETDSGFVYNAYQASVGREVAITVIRPELANDPAFIRRFERGARLVSQLDHPQIVPLYDYWREPDAAYLITRRYGEGTLDDALAAGSVPTELAVRVIDQVGGALAAAHRRGVVHGAVAPANIVLDTERNAHLTGFGLRSSGTEFRAPELGDDETPTPLADVFSFAAVAADALRRSTDETDAPLVGPAATVVGRATSPDPADRHETVEEFLAALTAALGGAPVATAPVDNPYRGLRAFDEGDAERFFGRERLVDRLVARLDSAGAPGRLIALVGPSGAGKSSVVRAGLIPAIRSGALPGSDRWFIVTMTPGQHPFEALEDALLRVAVNPPPSILERLLDRGVADTVSSLLPEEGTQLLLVVDQLEELFSHASPQATERFLGALAETAADRHSRVKVVATLRADFYDHPLRHRTFGELLRLGTEVITPMTPQELEQAVAGPAAGVGVDFERGLVSQIVADMQGQAAALPLLQYALTELFDARTGATIRSRAYEELGGVSAALVRRADGIFGDLDGSAQGAARDVFLRLVNLGEGAEDTRRRALLAELTDGGGHAVSEVIDTFGRHRLLSFDRDPTTRGPTVELAHEALITEWLRLREWIAEARSDVRAQRRLASAASEWRERDHDAGYLLTGPRLTRYAEWDDSPPMRLTRGEGQFLAASNEAAEAERHVERRRVRNLRRLAGGALAALAVAIVAGVFAFRESQRANDEADAATTAAQEAELSALISRSAASIRDDPEVALLLALEANRRAPSPETEQAVLNALGSSSFAPKLASFPPLHGPDCRGVIGSDGGIAYAAVDGVLVSRDVLTGQISEHGAAPMDCVQWLGDETLDRKVAFADEGDRIWVGPFDGEFDTERTFETPTFSQLASFRPTGRLYVMSFPDDADPEFSMLDDRTLETVGEPITGGRDFVGAEFTDDGALAAVSFATPDRPQGDGEVVVVDGVTGDEVLRLALPVPVGELIFDEFAPQLLGASFDGRLITIDLELGEVVADVGLTATAPVTEMEIAPDGLVTAISAGQLEVVDRMTGPVGEPVELRGVEDARVRPDGLLLSIEPGGATSVISLDSTALVERSYDIDPFAQTVLRDGRAASAAFGAGPPELVDLSTGERSPLGLATAEGEPYAPYTVIPDDDGLWTYGGDGAVTRWEDGSAVASVPVPGVPFGEASNGDRWIIMTWTLDVEGSEVAHVVALDQDGPTVEQSLSIPDLSTALPTPDGGFHAVRMDGVLTQYAADGESIREIETGLRDVHALSVNAAGDRVVLAADEDGLAIVDLTTGEVQTLSGVNDVVNVGFARDGAFLVLTSRDGTVRLWDVERDESAGLVWDGTGARGGEPPWYDEATDVVWVSTSGKLIAVPLDPQVWIAQACEAVGRDLTQDEWNRFVPGDDPTVRSGCG